MEGSNVYAGNVKRFYLRETTMETIAAMAAIPEIAVVIINRRASEISFDAGVSTSWLNWSNLGI